MAKRREDADPVEDVADVDDVVEDDDELEDGLDDELDDDLEEGGEDEEEVLPEGFSVVDPDEVADDGDDEPAAAGAVADAARAVAVLEAAGRDVLVAGLDDGDDEDELAVRRDGEFICSRCHLVKRDTQLARPRLRICRDCA